ncbi:ShlB/FhaC/HecB family hemolysin secretion/activation protein [Niveispirillum sp. KHB5.9]|uniref:ShlB/FhaC/HecB family hemolysin secretion/activation protein n=1 Tax=Niveispirillum sp. KHB5.9 TaxID=3400269 RepID=UPI003A8932DD
MAIQSISRGSRRFGRKLASGTAMLLLLAGPSLAQQTLPPVAEPRRPDLAAPARPAAPAQGGIEIAPAPGVAPVAGAATTPLTLSRVAVEGADTMPAGSFDDLTAAITGKPVTLADLYATADAITARYRDAGWVLARAVVPAQRITDGVATIRVVEGFIAKTVVEGDTGAHAGRIQSYLDHLTATKGALNIQDLERWLLLVNDLPGVSARAVLSPAVGQTGGSVLTLKVEQQTVQAYAAIDNRGSVYAGPWRLSAGAAFNTAADGGRFTISGLTALEDPEEQQGLTLSWDQQVGSEGTILGVRGSIQRGEPGDSLEALEVTTRYSGVTLRAAHPFLRTRAKSLMVDAEFNAYETRTAFFGQRFAQDVVRTLSLGADFTLLDQAGGANRFAARVVQGLDMMGATRDGSTDKSRAAGSSEFTRMTFEAERVQALGNGMSARLALTAQIADRALLAQEEFKLGGAAFGRAFDDGELSGDQGVAGLVELRYALPVGEAVGVQLYGFYDHGKVWNDDPVTQIDGVKMASVGAGLRANLDDTMSADLAVAKPLRRDVATKGDRDARFFVAVTTRF